MSNKDKLLQVMKDYSVPTIYYSPSFEMEAETPSGIMLIPSSENALLECAIYKIFTRNGLLDEDQDFTLVSMPPTANNYEWCRNKCTEVLNASI